MPMSCQRRAARLSYVSPGVRGHYPVTLAELSIEGFYPADEVTATILGATPGV
jgi:hypothetical protein